jgi:hypothetical protein
MHSPLAAVIFSGQHEVIAVGRRAVSDPGNGLHFNDQSKSDMSAQTLSSLT